MALWYDEVINDQVRFGLKLKRTLFMGENQYQTVSVVETEAMGRALLIDDLWMTSEVDEKGYHEMITHPAMVTAPKIERVLIIGGGDGGTAREVLRYSEVKHLDMVEIDGMVVDASKEFLPSIGGSAWTDSRFHLTIGDGIEWVNRKDLEPYDVIIVDGSDPVGPAEGLFNKSFYQACFDRLTDDGVFVTQSESAILFLDTHVEMVNLIKEVFGLAFPYYRGVFLYSAGPWSWTYASKKIRPENIVDSRMSMIEDIAEIYNRDIHHGIFAIPNYVRRRLKL